MSSHELPSNPAPLHPEQAEPAEKDPMSHRQDDAQRKTFFRTEGRIIHQDGQWYFLAREGERGPYASKEAAEIAMRRFVTEANWLKEQEQEKLTTHIEDHRASQADPDVWANRPDTLGEQ